MSFSPPPWWLAAAVAAALAACSPQPKAAEDADGYLRAQGYSPAPTIRSVTGGGGTVTITGDATPGGRVSVIYNLDRSFAVTADSRGRYTIDVPIGVDGGLYDIISRESPGREIHADGRLFVPSAAPHKAVLLRGGAPSLPVSPAATPGIAVIDYDAHGAMMITGRETPGAAISVTVDDESWPKQPPAGADGLFAAVCQFYPPDSGITPVHVTVSAGRATWSRVIAVSTASAGDRITPMDGGGWRVDWIVPGGGKQTALVL